MSIKARGEILSKWGEYYVSFPGSSGCKESICNAEGLGSIPWPGKIPWRREWQPTPVFLPGELHGQRSLVGYRLCHKEPGTTERLTHTVFKLPFHLHMCNIQQVNSTYLYSVAEKIIEKF